MQKPRAEQVEDASGWWRVATKNRELFSERPGRLPVRLMSVRRNAYTTKELTVRTGSDFVSLFSKGNGWDFCWRMYFQRPRTLPKSRRTRAERGVRNRRQKKDLVEQGLAHGILVKANGEQVGWCQYGPREELSRIDTKRNYRELSLWAGTEKLWRITLRTGSTAVAVWRVQR